MARGRPNLTVGDALTEALDDLARDSPTSPECDDGLHGECGGAYATGPWNLTREEVRKLPTHPCRCSCGHPHLKQHTA